MAQSRPNSSNGHKPMTFRVALTSGGTKTIEADGITLREGWAIFVTGTHAPRRVLAAIPAEEVRCIDRIGGDG